MSRQLVSSNTPGQRLANFSRAVRVGDMVFVSGATASDEAGATQHPGRGRGRRRDIGRAVKSSTPSQRRDEAFPDEPAPPMRGRRRVWSQKRIDQRTDLRATESSRGLSPSQMFDAHGDRRSGNQPSDVTLWAFGTYWYMVRSTSSATPVSQTCKKLRSTGNSHETRQAGELHPEGRLVAGQRGGRAAVPRRACLTTHVLRGGSDGANDRVVLGFGLPFARQRFVWRCCVYGCARLSFRLRCVETL